MAPTGCWNASVSLPPWRPRWPWVRAGGTVGRVGAPQYSEIPAAGDSFFGNITITGGVAPARAYIEVLLPDVLEGRIQPGKVFDRTIALDEVPAGYQAMADRSALKVMVGS